jgi:hypothetical protein
VTSYRSTRIEQILGGRVDSLTFDDLRNLVNAGVREQFDLEFKRQHYGNGNAERRDLCGDIAALANTAGGVLFIGVDEDDQAQASAVVGVDITDTQIGRIRLVVAAGVSPLPPFDIHPVADPTQPDVGALVIAVPRSVRQPHAVLAKPRQRHELRRLEAAVAVAGHRKLDRADLSQSGPGLAADTLREFPPTSPAGSPLS